MSEIFAQTWRYFTTLFVRKIIFCSYLCIILLRTTIDHRSSQLEKHLQFIARENCMQLQPNILELFCCRGYTKFKVLRRYCGRWNIASCWILYTITSFGKLNCYPKLWNGQYFFKQNYRLLKRRHRYDF